MTLAIMALLHASFYRAMSGDVGDRDPPRNSIMCSHQHLGVIGWF